jgi:hypothetical protein
VILDELQTLILADAGVSALVAARVYDGVLPRGFTLPAVVYHTVVAPSNYTFEGNANPNEIKVQFDIYGDSAAQVRSVQKAIKNVLQNLRGALSGHNVIGSFWNFDQDMPFEPSINKVAVGFRSLSQVTVMYI